MVKWTHQRVTRSKRPCISPSSVKFPPGFDRWHGMTTVRLKQPSPHSPAPLHSCLGLTVYSAPQPPGDGPLALMSARPLAVAVACAPRDKSSLPAASPADAVVWPAHVLSTEHGVSSSLLACIVRAQLAGFGETSLSFVDVVGASSAEGELKSVPRRKDCTWRCRSAV